MDPIDGLTVDVLKRFIVGYSKHRSTPFGPKYNVNFNNECLVRKKLFPKMEKVKGAFPSLFQTWNHCESNQKKCALRKDMERVGHWRYLKLVNKEVHNC